MIGYGKSVSENAITFALTPIFLLLEVKYRPDALTLRRILF